MRKNIITYIAGVLLVFMAGGNLAEAGVILENTPILSPQIEKSFYDSKVFQPEDVLTLQQDNDVFVDVGRIVDDMRKFRFAGREV